MWRNSAFTAHTPVTQVTAALPARCSPIDDDVSQAFAVCVGRHVNCTKENRMADKKADLAGPGIGDYTELEQMLPADYSSLLSPKETQKAIFEVKNYIEEN